jgi:hypothetical protein
MIERSMTPSSLFLLALLAIHCVTAAIDADATRPAAAAPPLPPWPCEYFAEVNISTLYGPTTGAAYYSVPLNAERWDVFGPNGTSTRRIFNYTAGRQYIIDAPSGNCFWLPTELTAVPTDPLPLSLGSYEGNATVGGQLCYVWRVPIYFQSSFLSYVWYYSNAMTGAPVRFHGGAVEHYDFLNYTADVPASAFEVDAATLAACQGPFEGVLNGSIPDTQWEFQSERAEQFDHLESPAWVGDLGGDGGQSIVLPPANGSVSRTYVNVDDSSFGFHLHGQRVNFYGPVANVVLLITGGMAPNYTDVERRFITGPGQLEGGTPLPFFTPPSEAITDRVWTVGGAVLRDGDGHEDDSDRSPGAALVMITQAYTLNNGTEYWLVKVPNVGDPVDAWRQEWFATPFSDDVTAMESAGTILTVHNDTTYAYILGHTTCKPTRCFHWARVPQDDLLTGNFSACSTTARCWVGWAPSTLCWRRRCSHRTRRAAPRAIPGA